MLSLEELLYLLLASREELTSLGEYLKSEVVETLVSRNLLETTTKKISDAGKILIFHLTTDGGTPPPYTEEFEKFWRSFPASDKHSHYPKTRVIRVNKEETYKEWLQATKTTSSEMVLKALQSEVNSRKFENFGVNNALKFMKSPVRWLVDKVYADLDVEPQPTTFTSDELM
jgi:hypothetical protein